MDPNLPFAASTAPPYPRVCQPRKQSCTERSLESRFTESSARVGAAIESSRTSLPRLTKRGLQSLAHVNRNIGFAVGFQGHPREVFICAERLATLESSVVPDPTAQPFGFRTMFS
jgi:hypothetical protein